MTEQGKFGVRYFLADPQTANPISVEVPVTYAGGSLVFIDLSTDFPESETLASSFARTGFGYAGADLLVLRCGSGRFAKRIETSDEVQRSLAEGQPVVCLVGDMGNGEGPALVRPSWSPPAKCEPTPAELRAIEMHGLLLGRRAIIEAPDIHYELAGGDHVRRYVRLRNALESPRDCQRICDWMAPSIKKGSQVIVAHRGLGTLEATIGQRFGVEVHRLPRYDEVETGDPHVPVSVKPDESRPQVLVIGVDTRTSDPLSPGGEREKSLNSYGFAEATRICLVDTTDPGPATDSAFAHLPIERHPATDCEYCNRSDPRTLCRIDVDEEIPEPLVEPRRAVAVDKGIIEQDIAFWKLVDRTDAAAVHVNRHYEHPQTKERVRHRSADLDVSKLLADTQFYAECQTLLSEVQPEDCLVLIPEHETADALEKLAKAALPNPTAVEIVPRLDPAKAIGPALREYERIVLLDDMIASGSTMRRLKANLRSYLGPTRFAEIDLRGFVILNCAPNKDVVNSVRAVFTGESGETHFSWRARVPLPHPGDGCPWCEEQRRLERQAARDRSALHSSYVARRIADLSEMPLRTISPVQSAASTVEGTLVQGKLSATAALLRWASATQAVRAKAAEESGKGTYYINAAFTYDRWQDWPQCAGILRIASRSEMRSSYQDDDFETYWNQGETDLKADKLAEFAWAAIEEKLPARSAELVLRTLDEKADEDPALQAMAEMLAVRGLRAAS